MTNQSEIDQLKYTVDKLIDYVILIGLLLD